MIFSTDSLQKYCQKKGALSFYIAMQKRFTKLISQPNVVNKLS